MRSLLYSARDGDTAAMRRLARILWDGTSGAGVDRRNAVAWWEKAAREGDTTSMIILGDMHARGLYFGKSLGKARQFYEMAEQAGSKTARNRLRALQNETNEAPPALRDPFEDLSYDEEANGTESAPSSGMAQAPDDEQNSAPADEGVTSLSARIAKISGGIRPESTQVEVECEVPQELMERYLEQCVLELQGDEKKIKRAMEVAALMGFAGFQKIYLQPKAAREFKDEKYEGPWNQAADMFNQKFMLADDREMKIAPTMDCRWAYKCSDTELHSAVGISNSCSLAPKIKHTCEVEWKNGLPVRARVIIDGSPLKSRLLLRPQK